MKQAYREKLSKLMTMANKLAAKGMKRAEALHKAWELVKVEFTARIAGTSYEGRQDVLDQLSKVNPSEIRLSLQREKGNAFDRSAVAVWGHVEGRVHCRLGYLPRLLALLVAPLLDKEKEVHVDGLSIYGHWNDYTNYGAKVVIRL